MKIQNSRNPGLTVFTSGRIGNSTTILGHEEPPLYPAGAPIMDTEEINTNENRKLQAKVEAEGGLLPMPELFYPISSNNEDFLYPIGINPDSFCEDCD